MILRWIGFIPIRVFRIQDKATGVCPPLDVAAAQIVEDWYIGPRSDVAGTR